MSSYLATKSEALKLVCQVIFCHPPGSQSADQLQAQPIKYFIINLVFSTVVLNIFCFNFIAFTLRSKQKSQARLGVKIL
jgi:hypothetical protein